MNGTRRPPSRAIVLAAGNGERLRAFTEQCFGFAWPKQYCTFVGTRSMFDHTVDRAAQWCLPSRITCVVAGHHRGVLASRPPRRTDGHFVFQPANRDTAPGILLGLSYVLHNAPDATVAVLPSDHFVYPEWRFVGALRAAAVAAETLPDRLILLGSPATSAEDEYGWILPGEALGRANGSPILSVRAFLEKPTPVQAQDAQRAGGVWNTFVIVAKAQTFWNVTAVALPHLVPYFSILREAIGTPDELAVLADIYETMPSHNYSSDVLECQSERTALLTLEGVTWSDWGRPERIMHTLTALGAHPPAPSPRTTGDSTAGVPVGPVVENRLP